MRSRLSQPGAGRTVAACDQVTSASVHKSMHLDADAAWVAVALREAKQQLPPECARCLLRAAPSCVEQADGRPRRLIEATVSGRGPGLMLPPRSDRRENLQPAPHDTSHFTKQRHSRCRSVPASTLLLADRRGHEAARTLIPARARLRVSTGAT